MGKQWVMPKEQGSANMPGLESIDLAHFDVLWSRDLGFGES